MDNQVFQNIPKQRGGIRGVLDDSPLELSTYPTIRGLLIRGLWWLKQLSGALKPLQLKVVFGRKYCFKLLIFPDRGGAAEGSLKVLSIYVRARALRKSYQK